MLDNNKFIAVIMAQQDLDFAEEFKSFSDEEQDAFVDFVIDIMSATMKAVKTLPQDEKIAILFGALSQFPPERRADLAMLIQTAEET
jgi:hypothetical protein